MQRRKFVIGLGSLAAGSAATLGTGAFESGEARGRRVAAEVEDDPDAYIGIEPANNPQGYAFARVGNGSNEETGEAIVDFNGIETNDQNDNLKAGVGEGPNGDATFILPDVLTLTNQTPEPVKVGLNATLNSSDVSGFDVGVPAQGNPVETNLHKPGVNISLDDDAGDKQLGVGETINVDFALDTTGFTSPLDDGSSSEDSGEEGFNVGLTVSANSV